MAFVSIANERGIAIECVVFPKIFTQYKDLLIKDTVVLIDGRVLIGLLVESSVSGAHSLRDVKG